MPPDNPTQRKRNVVSLDLPPELLDWYSQHAAKRGQHLGRRYTRADDMRIALEEYRERNTP